MLLRKYECGDNDGQRRIGNLELENLSVDADFHIRDYFSTIYVIASCMVPDEFNDPNHSITNSVASGETTGTWNFS